MSALTDRLKEFNLQLKYESGSDTEGVITNYKPPKPIYFRKGSRTIGGYTQFQDNVASDCMIEFTVAFQIKGDTDAETLHNIEAFKRFRANYHKRFIFIDEFQTIYKGYLQTKFDIDTPIEGDIYMISTEMLCNHDVSGWVSDSSSGVVLPTNFSTNIFTGDTTTWGYNDAATITVPAGTTSLVVSLECLDTFNDGTTDFGTNYAEIDLIDPDGIQYGRFGSIAPFNVEGTYQSACENSSLTSCTKMSYTGTNANPESWTITEPKVGDWKIRVVGYCMATTGVEKAISVASTLPMTVTIHKGIINR